jgi:hypothetical protein
MHVIRSRLFWFSISLVLLPFVVLAFLNNMALDDYLFYDIYRTGSFFKVQHALYTGWAGRYTSNLLIGCFVRLDLPARYPFLTTLLYFGLTYGAICYLLSSLRFLFAPRSPFSPHSLASPRSQSPPGSLAPRDKPLLARAAFFQAGAVLFFLFLYVQADIATSFYWFSAIPVYQTAFILFLLLVAAIVRRMTRPTAFRTGDVFLLLLVFLTMGCNEIMDAILPLVLAAMAAAFIFFGRRVPRWLWLCLATALSAGLLIFFTSGVMIHRQMMLNTGTGYLTILPVVCFRAITVFFDIFKEPLFWVMAVMAFGWGTRIAECLDPEVLAIFRRKDVSLPGLLALLLVVLLSLGAYLLASHGSIPARALNNLDDVVTICILILCSLAGVHRADNKHPAVFPVMPAVLRLVVLVAVMLASVNYSAAWKSVVSGYFYHAVLSQRDRQLTTAQEEHRRTAGILVYDSALEEKIRATFPHGVFSTVHAVLLEKPPLLPFYDGAGNEDPFYLHFYGLDTIILRRK